MSALRKPVEFSRRGACPALSAPMQTGDGLLVRLNPVADGLSPGALIGLCQAAFRHGNGVVEVTARGSLQLRGLTARSAKLLAAEVDALGIAVRTGVPVQTGDLAGLDLDEIADPSGLADRLRAAIATSGLGGKLGAKVSVIVDGGGRSGLDAVAADVRLTAEHNGDDILWRLAVAGDAQSATSLGVAGEDGALAGAIATLQAIAARGNLARARDVVGELAYPATDLRGQFPRKARNAADRGATGRRQSLLGTYRLSDSRIALGIALPFGHLRAETLITFAEHAAAFAAADIRLAPKRTILTLCSTIESAQQLQDRAATLGFVVSESDPRTRICACPGAPSCASGHIAARNLALEFAEEFGGVLDSSVELHISGCAKGCAHPTDAALTVVGSENGAGLVVGGTARSAPLAYTADAGRGLAGIAHFLLEARNAGEDSAATQARLGDAENAERAFGR